MSSLVLALVDDLIFASRISADAARAGAEVQRVGSAAALKEAARHERPALIVVDLDGMAFDGVAALTELRDEPQLANVPKLAYGSHVDPERLDAATHAGATAMPRSRFVRDLQEWIARSTG